MESYIHLDIQVLCLLHTHLQQANGEEEKVGVATKLVKQEVGEESQWVVLGRAERERE